MRIRWASGNKVSLSLTRITSAGGPSSVVDAFHFDTVFQTGVTIREVVPDSATTLVGMDAGVIQRRGRAFAARCRICPTTGH